MMGVLCKLEDIIRNKINQWDNNKKNCVEICCPMPYTCECLNCTFCQLFRSLFLESVFKALLRKLV
jgi:hypothetical protein